MIASGVLFAEVIDTTKMTVIVTVLEKDSVFLIVTCYIGEEND